MRRSKLTFRLIAAGLATMVAGPAFAQACANPVERTAFEVRALQSHLMVVALSCARDQDYNAFVNKFRRDLGTVYTSIEGHFRRTAGGSFQRARDGFITQLANDHSQDGLRQGSQFCINATPLFQVALAQSNTEALAEMAKERNVLNPFITPACPERPVAATPARRATR